MQTDLSRHEATHFSDNRFHSCRWPDCQKSFSRKQSLEKHVEKEHSNGSSPAQQIQVSTGGETQFLLDRCQQIAKAVEKQKAEEHRSIIAFLDGTIRQHVELMGSLLSQGTFDINHTDIRGRRALHVAAEKGGTTSIRFLLSKGANPQIINRSRRTPLAVAAARGHVEAVKTMLDLGTRDSQNLALLETCTHGHMACAQVLLPHSIDVNEGNCLIEAVKNDHPSIVRLLLGCGVQLNRLEHFAELIIASRCGYEATVELMFPYEKRETVRYVALLEACSKGHLSVVQFLLAKGLSPYRMTNFHSQSALSTSEAATLGDKELSEPPVRPSMRRVLQSYQTTALRQAISSGHVAVVRALLNDNGSTGEGTVKNLSLEDANEALLYASSFGNWGMMQYFLERGADIDFEGSTGMTALMEASCHGYKNCVQCLIERGADVSHANRDGDTVLIQISQLHDPNVSTSCAQLLIDHGADVNHDGDTALFHLTKQSFKFSDLKFAKYVGFLLECGVDINHQNLVGGTALMHASMCSNIPATRCLLEHGADVSYKDSVGDTALTYIAKSGPMNYRSDHPECMQLLLQYGANINDLDNRGRTALIHASIHRLGEVVQALLKFGANAYHIDDDGRTALFYASRTWNGDFCLRLLLNHGNGIDPCSEMFQQALEGARQAGISGNEEQLLYHARSKNVFHYKNPGHAI